MYIPEFRDNGVSGKYLLSLESLGVRKPILSVHIAENPKCQVRDVVG